MHNKYFLTFLVSLVAIISVNAQDAVFGSNEAETFDLQPLSIETKSPVNSNVKPAVQIKQVDSELSNQNFMQAIGNLDNAQVELREQLSSYSALMAQAKSSYLAQRSEYRAYKKQYNDIKRKISKIEKSKKLIKASTNEISASN